MAGFSYLGSRPRHGKIIVNNASEKKMVIKGNIKYENDFLSFEYPDNYEKTGKDDDLWLYGRLGTAESFTLLCRDFGENINEDSGVKMRQVKTQEYDEENIKIAGVEGLLFIKKDQSERTVFILRNKKLISLSMISRSNGGEAEEKFQKIIDSWQWNHPSPAATDW